MKKLQFLFLFLLPFTVFSQYTKEWELTEIGNNQMELKYASKVLLQKNGKLFSSYTSKTKGIAIARINSEGYVEYFYPYNFSSASQDLTAYYGNDREFSIDESDVNSFEIVESSNNVTYTNAYHISGTTFKIPLNILIIEEGTPLLNWLQDIKNLERRFSCLNIHYPGEVPTFCDTVWLGNLDNTNKLQDYKLLRSNVFNSSRVSGVLTPDTIPLNIGTPIGVPIASKLVKDSVYVMVVAAKELIKSEPVDISFRFFNHSLQDVSRFKIPAAQFAEKDRNFTIRDILVINETIYFVGATYTNEKHSFGLIGKVNTDGSNFSYSVNDKEGTFYKSLKVLDSSTFLVVGAIQNMNSVVSSNGYCIEYSQGLLKIADLIIESSGKDTLFGVEPISKNEFVVCGSKNDGPYIGSYKKDPNTNVSETTNNAEFLASISNKTLKLLFTNLDAEESTIRLYTVNGMYIKNLHTGRICKNQPISSTLEDISTGVYFIITQIGSKIMSHKLFIQNS